MTMISGGMTHPTYERRIGTRHRIGVDLEWSPIDGRRRRRRVSSTVATLENVSVSGVGIDSATDPEILYGAPVRLELGGTSCQGTVRTIRPSATPEHTYYGIRFEGRQPIEAVVSLVEEHSPRDHDEVGGQRHIEGSYYSERLLRRMGA